MGPRQIPFEAGAHHHEKASGRRPILPVKVLRELEGK